MRLGFLADFLSRTVLAGFLTGVGIQVAVGELHGMLGLEKGGAGFFRGPSLYVSAFDANSFTQCDHFFERASGDYCL